MKIRTSELTGAALDWAVAKCKGKGIEFDDPNDPWLTVDGIADQPLHSYTPSTDWSQGGPIIEREIGNLWKNNKLHPNDRDIWTAAAYCKAPDGTLLYYEDGPTPLIAAMRCLVASKLGDEVEVPDELVTPTN